jgi:hypothetical protein
LPPLAELTTAPEEPPAPAGTEGEGGPHPSGLALPRKRSSVPRPWATGRPGENTDRIRVRELLPKGRPDVEPGPTQRINTPPPIALGDRESDRTLRLDVRELGTPENLPTLPPRSPVGEAHVPNREFGTGEQGTGELSAGDISLPPVKGGTSDLHIEEVPSGLEGDAFVPEGGGDPRQFARRRGERNARTSVGFDPVGGPRQLDHRGERPGRSAAP